MFFLEIKMTKCATHEDDDGTGYCIGCGVTIGEPHHSNCGVVVFPAPPADEYYLQCGYSGNDLLFWRQGRAGYTTDLNQAHVFTRKEAFGQHAVRDIDVPREKSVMDAIAHRSVAQGDLLNT